jgi:tRNA (uracil-5-)-methyltransferase
MYSNTKIIRGKDCPIATPVINEAYSPIREKIIKSVFILSVPTITLIVLRRDIYTYKKGVSLLLRDSLDVPVASTDKTAPVDTVDSLSTSSERHVCVSDHRAVVRERVGQMLFEYPGGSFFQNNNSVLVPLTDYVRDSIFFSSSGVTRSDRPTHLVDAYCGAGLFAITLSPHFDVIAGIELSSDSIKFATRNARLNNIPEEKCSFRAGDAADIFAAVPEFAPEHTALIVDPPRKGCDENFIKQLLTFSAEIVVYVSCNVHTQARDIGMILKRSGHEAARTGGKQYVLQSLRGFDLFPQTAHVESVAVLCLQQPSD